MISPLTGSLDPTDPPSTATRILDAAEELFAQRGYAAVSVREIAGRVGLNQASIYNHFDSKQALYEAVVERGLGPILELLSRAASPAEAAPGDALLDALLDQLWRTPHFPKLMQREILDDGEVLERLCDRWLRPIYDEGVRTLEAAGPDRRLVEAEIPFLVIGLYHLVFGQFISSALTRRVAGVDPSDPASRETQRVFLRRVGRLLIGVGPD